MSAFRHWLLGEIQKLDIPRASIDLIGSCRFFPEPGHTHADRVNVYPICLRLLAKKKQYLNLQRPKNLEAAT